MTINLQFTLQGQRALFNEWIVHADDGRPASRAAMKPAQFLTELAYISILEQSPEGWRFRLSGSDIRRRLGREMKGRLISEIGSFAASPFWGQTLAQTVSSGEPMQGVNPLSRGRVHVWLRLPLVAHRGGPQVLCHDRFLTEAELSDALADGSGPAGGFRKAA